MIPQVLPVLASAVLALTLLAGAAAAGPVPDESGAYPTRPRIVLDAGARDRLVLRAPGYRLTLNKRNGGVIGLVDSAAGASLVRGSNGCLWGAVQEGRTSYVGGCAFAPAAARRFSYSWDRGTATLVLRYRDTGPDSVDAVVTLRAHPSAFDLRATLENRSDAVLEKVHLPVSLIGDVASAEAGYAPNYLPGVRFGAGFFSRVANNIFVYPSRWAFADYLALDADGGHLSLSAVAPERPYPAEFGFVHGPEPGDCSGKVFCVVHAFQTWIRPGEEWASPVVRIRVGQTVAATIAGYRRDNGIDEYPSLAEKVGERLPVLAQAPLVKADLPKLRPFSELEPDLRRLPTPSLLHPVAFQPGGHDGNDPDFLPPDPRWGTTADLRATVASAHELGLLVMPYLNVSWWDEASPTLRALTPLAARDIAVRDVSGTPLVEAYDGKLGLVASPHAPLVRERVAGLMDEWRDEVPADCLFFDQLGARAWLRDFNPAAPNPLAYHDGWLGLMAPYGDRCLMVEDGWDRLARDFSGFHGGALMMARELDEPDGRWGEGNWEPYPLAIWLLHDKVLLYQHDLYEGTMTTDAEVLTWNMAFGLISSYSWDHWRGTLSSPWLGLVGSFQRAVGPHYAGVPLSRYRTTDDGRTESTFGDLVVTANWDAERRADVEGHGIAPVGFLARTGDDRLLAGAFEGTFNGSPLSAGVHYVIVERGAETVTVRQPVGADTPLAVDPPRVWRQGRRLRATALGRDGAALGDADGELRDGRFRLRYAAALDGRAVAGYRIALD